MCTLYTLFFAILLSNVKNVAVKNPPDNYYFCSVSGF